MWQDHTYRKMGLGGGSFSLSVKITDRPRVRLLLRDGNFSSVSLGLPRDMHRASEEGRCRDHGAVWMGQVGGCAPAFLSGPQHHS